MPYRHRYRPLAELIGTNNRMLCVVSGLCIGLCIVVTMLCVELLLCLLPCVIYWQFAL
jgi:hypothetical protein